MRVNSRVFTERTDMLDGIQIPNCPAQFKVVAERIMNMVTKPGFSIGAYHTATELDKWLMVDYWQEYDNLDTAHFDIWFVTRATSPELVRRARQWLSEHNYVFLDADVADHAAEAGDRMRKAIRG